MWKIVHQKSLLFIVMITFLCFYGVTNSSYCYYHQSVDEKGIVGDLYKNEFSSSQPAIIMLGGSEGGNGFNQSTHLIQAATNLGYCVMTLSYFDYKSKGTLPNKLKNIPLEYFSSAMDWLGDQPDIDGTEFSVVGVSRGAELALILASIYPKISAVVAIVPSAYIWGPFNNNKFIIGSAWSYQGKHIPSIRNIRTFFYKPWWTIINNPKKVERYFIPVEKMSASLLLISGKYDNVWPSTEMADRIIKRLDSSGYPYQYKHIAYHGAHDILKMSTRDILIFLTNNYPSRTNSNTAIPKLKKHMPED